MLGVGGGIFNGPASVLLLGIPLEIATATSHFMVMGTPRDNDPSPWLYQWERF